MCGPPSSITAMQPLAPPLPSQAHPVDGPVSFGGLPGVLASALLAAGDHGVCHGFTGGFPRGDEQEQAGMVLRWLERQMGRKVPPPLLMAQPHGRGIADVAGPI